MYKLTTDIHFSFQVTLIPLIPFKNYMKAQKDSYLKTSKEANNRPYDVTKFANRFFV